MFGCVNSINIHLWAGITGVRIPRLMVVKRVARRGESASVLVASVEEPHFVSGRPIKSLPMGIVESETSLAGPGPREKTLHLASLRDNCKRSELRFVMICATAMCSPADSCATEFWHMLDPLHRSSSSKRDGHARTSTALPI